MSEDEDIERIVSVLKNVPEKKLLIIDLANQVPIKDGVMDYDFLSKHQQEVNLATIEAKTYGAHTIQAVESLVRLRSREED